MPRNEFSHEIQLFILKFVFFENESKRYLRKQLQNINPMKTKFAFNQEKFSFHAKNKKKMNKKLF